MEKETVTTIQTPVHGAISARDKDKVLLHCAQTRPASFTDVLTPNMLKQCAKIGEGVYGDVYKTKRDETPVVLKMIPIAGDFCVNGKPQKTFEEILSEIVISKELSDLRHGTVYGTGNFVEVKRVSLVEGRYHSVLLHQWDMYAKKNGTLNDRPDMFPDTQLFVVFELEACGCTLNSFEFNSLEEAYSVMAQVTLALAVAEKALQFEHRDLHWGNVLITRMPYTDSTTHYHMDGIPVSINSRGLHVSIIDFSLSRISRDGCSMFCDLSTEVTLFGFKGDCIFDIYRNMRQENDNRWEEYHPYTNVLWLHYFVDKLLKYPKYPDSSIKEHHRIISHFRTFLRVALDCDSAYDLVTECSFFDDMISCEPGIAQANEDTISQNYVIPFHPCIPSACSYQPPSPQAYLQLLASIYQPYNLGPPSILSYPSVESPSSCPFSPHFSPFAPSPLPPPFPPHCCPPPCSPHHCPPSFCQLEPPALLSPPSIPFPAPPHPTCI